ncbi:App1 family protein [Hymenobacter sp. GOD-10R]|uniref:App1 family protein n=1 Tax=Hymenobacter sp. GOD-10R TaxID=3093922 RepID=UPI002D78F140|nr:phosphatase domain-containing protein [Hymenobacter sp. GOD-10R]WRQ26323.1 phosphatase domain-containing protein [Hymenobacter sp. GOD-10R]
MPLLDKLNDWAERADDLVLQMRARLGLLHPLQIVPYCSYGTPSRLYVKGRLLTDKGIGEPSADDSRWQNLLNMYRRFESNEIPDAQLLIRPADGSEHPIMTDEEGYFTLNLEPSMLGEPIDYLWYAVDVELKAAPAPIPTPPGIHAQARVLIPPADAEYGVISDLDDTVIQTSATDLLQMARTVLLRNAHSRLPFKGVAEFYRALQLGRNGKRNNPFFYVSSSPWNLYDLLEDFLALNKIPAGPILLRDMALSRKRSDRHVNPHHGHKLKEIENLLLTYPKLPFVLIGDSGQEDANIYREVVQRHPNRILAIYIRDIMRPDRATLVEKVAEDLLDNEHKVEMLLVQDTVQAAEHAARTGLIFTEAIPAIEKEKQKDE